MKCKIKQFRRAILTITLMTLTLMGTHVYAQTNYYENDIYEEIGKEGVSFYGCDQNSSTYNIYKTKEYWIPTTNTVEKIIPINIHVFQKSDGTNNWQNNSTDIGLLNWFFDQASNLYESNIAPSDPVAGVNEVTSAKIKLVVNAIYFYQDDNLNSSSSVYSMNTFINNISPNNLKGGFNYYLTEGYYSGAAGFSNGFYICTLKSYSAYVANNDSKWGAPKHIAHEFGHVFNIRHTYNQGIGGGQAICDPNNIDYISDIYTTTNPCPHDAGWTCVCNSSSNTCTNNIMGGTNSSGYYSPMQAGIMNRTLSMDLASMFVHEDTYTSIPKEITTDELWDFSIRLYQDLVIKSGNTLTIKCNVYMPPLAKIIVEPNAKLIIDGGTITNPMNSDKFWQGIEIWGNSNQSQVPHTNGLSDYQGEVEVINGGTIENAINAIAAIKHNPDDSKDWSKTGGIVTLNGAIFKNNNYDVWIGGYHNFFPSTGREIRNYSKIIDCDFENNDDMFPAYNGYAFVGLWDVGSIMIKGNTFKNLKAGQATEDKGIGIIVWSSTVNISDYCPSTGISYVNLSQSQALSNTPCTNAERNYFEGLYYGIRSLTSNTASNSIVHIDRAEFNNVYHGIHLLNTDYAVVTRCDFDISSTDPAASSSNTLYDAYGIYLDGCEAYRIEENTFNKYDAQQGIRGVVIDNSGDNNNEIYKNYLNNIGYAIQAQEDNTNISTGLGIYCNEMSGDYMDITVLDDGIKQHQKIELNSSNGYDYFAAGNIFTTCNSNNYQNYYNASSQSITYYPDANNVPQCHNINIYNGAPLNRSCPTKLGGTLSYALQAKADAVLALNSANTIYYIWKDGGNANLENEVETTQPWDVYVQFNELIAESPYISNEVLIATIESPAFTSLMIKLLMIANPHGITNGEVMEAVYNRIPALPQNYIDEILAEEGEISQLEILEANVAACKHEVDKQSNDIERLYRMEMNDGDDATDYISFLSSLGTIKSEYKLAELYLNLSDYTNMQSVLDAIPNDYSLTTEQSNEYNAWLSYYNIAKAMKQEGIYQGALTETQIAQLEALTGSQYTGVVKSALSLLMLNNPDYEYNEIVKQVDISSARKAKPGNTMTETSESKVLKVYPNPSYDFITVEYRTGDKYNKLWIEIKDVTGKSVLTKTLEGGNNEELVNTSNLSPNVYTLLLYGDGELIETTKITVLE